MLQINKETAKYVEICKKICFIRVIFIQDFYLILPFDFAAFDLRLFFCFPFPAPAASDAVVFAASFRPIGVLARRKPLLTRRLDAGRKVLLLDSWAGNKSM